MCLDITLTVPLRLRWQHCLGKKVLCPLACGLDSATLPEIKSHLMSFHGAEPDRISSVEEVNQHIQRSDKGIGRTNILLKNVRNFENFKFFADKIM